MTYSIFVSSCMSFTSDLVYFALINDKAESHMFCVCYQGLAGPYKQYLGPHQGHTAVHPTTLQAHNCNSDGTLSS